MAEPRIKSEIIMSLASKLAENGNTLPDEAVGKGINVLIDYMCDALANDQRIEVRGFGNFTLHHRPPRNSHNPRTRERTKTPARHVPHFKPGKELKQLVDASRLNIALDEDLDQ